jgi:hypothetical protein
MSSQLEDVEAAALQLTPEERAHLADRFLATFRRKNGILGIRPADAQA